MRRLVPYLGLLAIVLAGLIPAGWMPTRTPDGHVQLVICTGTGPEAIWVDLETGAPSGGVPDHDEHASDRSCPFAAFTTVVAPSSPEEVLPLMGPMRDIWYRAPFTHHTAGFHWRYDARGPPALS